MQTEFRIQTRTEAGVFTPVLDDISDSATAIDLFSKEVIHHATKAAYRSLGGDYISIELRRIEDNEILRSVTIHNYQS